MRVSSIAGSAMLAAALVLPAEAQVNYNAPIPSTVQAPNYRVSPPTTRVRQDSRMVAMPRHGAVSGQVNHQQRWGGNINGRWHAGVRAPGGWNAYHRLDRGDRLSRYWRGSDFAISDFLAWGLAAPPYGYHWARYYDDAVLIDDDGRVWDSVDGIRWDGDADAYAYADDYAAESYSESHASVGAGYSRPPLHGDSVGSAWGGSAPPVRYQTPAAPSPVVQASGYSSYAYSSGGASVTVINIPGPVTTTTTTTEQVVTSYQTVAKKRSYRPRRVVRRAVSSCCACGCR